MSSETYPYIREVTASFEATENVHCVISMVPEVEIFGGAALPPIPARRISPGVETVFGSKVLSAQAPAFEQLETSK